ncbi:ATP-binding protein [Pseudobacteriovorax antillogorgiicola]|uniref:histidine kinase n=1 Tax=Pseudobacteriovorax antillogorgiicola TaxID=1513793 RepID=A0A1Y6C345_9BACT|nr:ATP-binding protein [Pseudobacteriovorax antillogorgiicola]TCS50326.1 Hpt domain-containing protein [Pseudobacteriovorax antillogorgiicola]SMF34496.1 Hpt domain-containing protein [Pseudobacteriovorax antillogorgiicola]
MGIRDHVKDKRLVKITGILTGLLLSGLALILSLGLPLFLELSLVLTVLLVFLYYVITEVERSLGKRSKAELYHLLNELNIGVINLSKLTVSESIAAIIDRILDRNLKETRYRNALFDRLELGIVTFGEKLVVKRASMASLEAIFGKNSEGKGVIDFLFEKTDLSKESIRSLEFHFTSVLGMPEMQWKLSMPNFPEELSCRFKHRKRFIKAYYIPIYEEKVVKEISIVLQDVTEHRRFQSEAVRREQEIEKIFALLQVSDSLFELFMDETRSLFEGIKADLKAIRTAAPEQMNDIANRMFRSVHTIKANSKLFKLNSIQDVAHEVEHYLSELRSGKIAYEPKTFIELTQKVMAISEEIYSYASLRKEILSSIDRKRDQNLKYRVQWIRSLVNQFAYILRDPQFEPRHLRTIQKEFGRALATFDRVSMRDYIKGYNDMIHDIARQLGKKVQDIETHLEYHYFEPNVMARINDILVHCLRNSVDHGIEMPDVRKSLGKPEKGLIRLSVEELNGTVTLRLEDDGHGIEVEHVKEKAVDQGIITMQEAEHISDQESLSLIFHPGFSTSNEVSEVSGRGLGMDAVRDTVNKINGQIIVESVDDRGTVITINLPSESEELLTPFMIYDLKGTVEGILKEYRAVTRGKLDFETSGSEDTVIFGDKWNISEKIRSVVNEIVAQTRQKCDIRILLETHKGRRRVDSYWFYRITFQLQGEQCFDKTLQLSKRLKEIQESLKRNAGSLIQRSSHIFEMNLPSNIPVPFSDFEFPVLLVCDEPEKLITSISAFFNDVMGGWDFDILTYRPGESLPAKLTGQPCIVVMDDHHGDEYAEMRSSLDRERDGVLLLTDEETDIEILDELHIMPQNIIFAPRQFEMPTLHRALASIILRRFLKDMIREGQHLSQRDIQKVSGFPQ